MDGTSIALDNEGWADVSLDLVRCIDMMMSMMADLPNKVNGLEQATQGLAAPSPISSAVPLHDLKNTTRQAAPQQDPQLEEVVWKWVEQQLQQIPLLQSTTYQEDSSSDNEPVVKREKRALKSGRDCTGVTFIKKIITWPTR